MTDSASNREIHERIAAIIEGETDSVAIMATVACELHHRFPHFHWTGFYRVVEQDVELEADHITCSSSTRSEIVAPVFSADGKLRAVLDVDSDFPDAFGENDARFLEAVCALFRNPAIIWG